MRPRPIVLITIPILGLATLSTSTGCGVETAPAPPTTVAAASETVVVGVKGMHCDGCANAIRTKVGRVDGIESCEVSLEGEQAVIVGDPAAMADARAAIETLGYEIVPATPAEPTSPEGG